MTQTSVSQKVLTYRVEITQRHANKTRVSNPHVQTAHQLGYAQLLDCTETRLIFIKGHVTLSDVQLLCAEVLADPVIEDFVIISAVTHRSFNETVHNPTIDVTLLPGVTDPAAENLLRTAQLLGITGLERVATGQHYTLSGKLTEKEVHDLAREVFSNPVIQRYAIDTAIEPPFFAFQHSDDTVEVIAILAADDQTLLRISSQRRLALDLNEMRAAQQYFRSLNREPTDVEMEMIAQTWSEHCIHKTFRAMIDYQKSPDSAVQRIDGLLRSYIRAATERVNKPWVRSAFVDNAGIVAFDDQWDLAFKVETHNHPSALEPFGGANTGVGGVIRDVIGVSARPIANTDVLCFGPQDLPVSQLPHGVLHPLLISSGVVHGVEDYGNKMGIPTVNGAILYHPGYTANPLVFCGCLGILPRDSHPTSPQPDDLIIVIGGRTGRDGLRGATFSSMEMDQATGDIAGTAVQIGHPIHEKQTLEVVLRARDERLYHALTDCGAGGLSSAVGEIGKELGVRVELNTVPLKYPGLRPWEIWLSEAQERMVLAVPPSNWTRLQAICAGQSIEAVCIGTFQSDGKLNLRYNDREIAALDMDFLHDGIPRRHLQAALTPHVRASSLAPRPIGECDPGHLLLQLLAHPNIRSKEDVIRLYDHEVQGATTIKPLTGVANHGPSDAAVLIPLGDLTYTASTEHAKVNISKPRGVAIGAGICPQYTELNPYAMAWAAMDEAMRNVVAVGADPDQISVLDNFCWGNPNLPDRLGSLVSCVQGCYDAAIAFDVPFISGKDSLNNEYAAADGRKHAIPGTLLISALGIVPDATRTTTMDLKAPGNFLFVIGDTRAEMGGSHLSLLDPMLVSAESPTPQPVLDSLSRMRALHHAIAGGLVESCHDSSEGGLAVTLAEMCLAGRLGADINLKPIPVEEEELDPATILFSESLSRFVVEVAPRNANVFADIMSSVPCAHVGYVTTASTLVIRDSTDVVVQQEVSALEHAWRGQVLDDSVQRTTAKPSKHVMQASVKPPSTHRILVLHATGTNRDRDAALACELAGGQPEIVHVNQLLSGERNLLDFGMLVVPGGFSYGDDLGAGTLWATDLKHRLNDSVTRFVDEGRPVLGICNGFQALVKAGLLPGRQTGDASANRIVTLAHNELEHFECRWVHLKINEHCSSIFTAGIDELIYCPVAHGEGRIVASDAAAQRFLIESNLVALTYVDAAGEVAGYPDNPNGSAMNIAGLTNATGNVLGLMPHPENHIFPWQHPHYRRGERGNTGLRLFENGIRHM